MAEASTHQQLDQMITGYWVSQAIYAAAKFGIADHLKDGPKTVGELAGATSTNPDALYRLMRALASVGIFAEVDSRRFSLTPLAEAVAQRCFRIEACPGGLMSGDEQFRAWAGDRIQHPHRKDRLRQGVRQADLRLPGGPSGQGLDFRCRVGRHSRPGIERHHSRRLRLLRVFGVVADIGGGNGSQITEITQEAQPDEGHSLRPASCHRASEGEESGVGPAGPLPRLVAGSFFDAVPAGADAYILRHIIHDWDEEKCLTILRNCNRAMLPESKLLVIESVIPPGNKPFNGKFLDLVMLLIPGGKERTEDEYRALFEQAGFELTRIVPTGSEVSIVEGKKTVTLERHMALAVDVISDVICPWCYIGRRRLEKAVAAFDGPSEGALGSPFNSSPDDAEGGRIKPQGIPHQEIRQLGTLDGTRRQGDCGRQGRRA